MGFERCAKGRDNHHIVGREFAQRNELLPARIHQKTHPPTQQIGVYVGVMNHFTQQKNALIRILGDGFVGNLDRIFDPITKPKMPGNVEPNRPKIEQAGREITLEFVAFPPKLFQGRDNGASIVVGDIERFHGRKSTVRTIRC